jgi:hypothetical protein
MGALRVAVTSSVLGSGRVSWETTRTTIGIHLRKVECTVKTTGKLRDINGKGELLVDEVESLILGCASGSHEVDTGADVLLSRLGNEFES